MIMERFDFLVRSCKLADTLIDVQKLTPSIGAEIFGVDLGAKISARQFQAIHQALLDHQVIFFRDQKMSVDQQKAFVRQFGELHIHPGPRFPIDGHPEILGIWADENSKRVSGEEWHSDVSCEPKPAMASMLYIHEVPKNDGGDTLFASMYAAFEALSDPFKRFLAGLTALHTGAAAYGGGRSPIAATNIPSAEHPVIRTHPETGRQALYVNRYFTSHIAQLSRSESNAVLEYLYGHAEKVEFQCRFKWRANSVAFWDNRCVQHKVIWDYFPYRRNGHRITVSGDRPFHQI